MTEDQVDEVAIKMCRALGIDPFEEVNLNASDWATPSELISSGGVSFCMSWTVPRWKSYRHAAAMAIAAKEATA